MLKIRTDLMREWKQETEADGIRFSFPAPKDAKGRIPCGFVFTNDSAADWTGWYGLELAVEGPASEEPAQLSITVEFFSREPLSLTVPLLLSDGKAHVELPFSLFPLEQAKENDWDAVTAVRLLFHPSDLRVTQCAAKRRQGLFLHMPVRGKTGEPGERVVYEGAVYNCSSRPLLVCAEQVFQGWESLQAELAWETAAEADGCGEAESSGVPTLKSVLLRPGEGLPLSASVTVHANMVPGGHETTLLRVWGQDGAGSCEDSVSLRTGRRLAHPYLYHDAEGWRDVKEKLEAHAFYEPAFQEYRSAADGWMVTDPLPGRDFCYETAVETNVMSAAYLYAITGEHVWAEKLADFYRRFSDPETGYPARKKGCSQSYVQEGHFFQHLAIGLDIIWDSGVLSEKELAQMEGCFRLYMELLDSHVRSGHISNWILSELTGALFCALTLQDMDMALRFAFGPGGIAEQFRFGVFNDGWWHECSVGYNTWVSSMLLHTAHALLPFGYDLIHAAFRIPFNDEVSSTFRCRPAPVKSGMYNLKWGGNRRNAVRIKDMFDAVIPFLDYRGVIFGISDSDEKKMAGVHFGSTYDLAYHYYRDEAYLPVIASADPDPIFGDPEVYQRALSEQRRLLADPDSPAPFRENACSDNIGLALLRSQTPGRPQREQLQAVLRYGSHGNAHGHFDITELLSVMRYGRSFFNPENCWWGYAHFMYKFYVQNSLTKNMVVVDEKMQVPADSRRFLWHAEPGLQAAGVQVKTRWAYPPYGGMVYEQDGQTATKEELRKRCRMNGCFLPIAEGPDSPEYGSLSGFTEEILQKRVMAVTDDYIVLFDYLEGEGEHQYDSLLQIKGFSSLTGEGLRQTHHTEQMNENPISDAQFITDCTWYEAPAPTLARFCTLFTEEHTGEKKKCDRSNYNEPGPLHMDVYTAWPPRTRQMIGRVAVYDGWAADGNGYTIPLSYRLELDGQTCEEGAFDGWILGRGKLDADVRGTDTASLILNQGCMHDEIGRSVQTPQGVFWGEICLELENGEILNLGKCLKEGRTDIASRIRTRNLDASCGVGRDYRGGRVTIVGTEYPFSLGASPVNHQEESRIEIDLKDLNAVRLTACVGVDAFPGDEWQKRKTYAVRSFGKTARYITVIEPYEKESVILRVQADGPDSVRIERKDGRIQTISVHGLDTDQVSIKKAE